MSRLVIQVVPSLAIIAGLSPPNPADAIAQGRYPEGGTIIDSITSPDYFAGLGATEIRVEVMPISGLSLIAGGGGGFGAGQIIQQLTELTEDVTEINTTIEEIEQALGDIQIDLIAIFEGAL